MKSFNEWFKCEIPNSHKKVGKEKIETVIYSCAESAWDHKQAEVDELQKRIDRAVERIEGYYGVVELSMIVDILNGDSHES